MRKEIIIAILISVTFGGILAFGIWRANSAFINTTPEPPSNNQGKEDKKDEDKDVKNGTQSASIVLSSPKSNVALSELELFSGLTIPDSWFVISAEDEDYIFPINGTGEFTQEVEILGGMNNIMMGAFEDSGKSAREKFQTFYSSVFVDQIYGEEEDKEETELTEEEIQERVQAKIKAASNIPTAYVGSITDIADSTIQIKSVEGEIQQVSTDVETTFVSIGKSIKEVNSEDLAIGDFISSMGFVNGQEVLKSTRILVFAGEEEVEKIIVKGTIEDLSNQTFELKDNYSGNVYTVDPNTGYLVWEFVDGERERTKYANLSDGDTVIVVGFVNEDDSSILDTRTIYITESTLQEEE